MSKETQVVDAVKGSGLELTSPYAWAGNIFGYTAPQTPEESVQELFQKIKESSIRRQTFSFDNHSTTVVVHNSDVPGIPSKIWVYNFALSPDRHVVYLEDFLDNPLVNCLEVYSEDQLRIFLKAALAKWEHVYSPLTAPIGFMESKKE